MCAIVLPIVSAVLMLLLYFRAGNRGHISIILVPVCNCSPSLFLQYESTLLQQCPDLFLPSFPVFSFLPFIPSFPRVALSLSLSLSLSHTHF